MTPDNPARDDLFTNIHKALRLALFDLTAQAGRTDWADRSEVAALGGRWRPLLELLRAHTSHEENHIFPILAPCDPTTTEPTSEQHHDLDDLLDDLAQRFEELLADPRVGAGLDLYRDLAGFVAASLVHLHDEETRVMARIWELCSNEELASTRAAFTADTTPEVMATTLEYMLPALDRPTRETLVARLAASSPPAVLQMVVDIAERVLDAGAVAHLRTIVTASIIAA